MFEASKLLLTWKWNKISDDFLKEVFGVKMINLGFNADLIFHNQT